MSSLGIVADGVARSHSDPLGQRSVLLLDLAQLLLDLERFLSLRRVSITYLGKGGGFQRSNEWVAQPQY